MPIQRFRRVEDMPPVAPPPSGLDRAGRLRALWGGWRRILPPLDLRGVRRYRDIEEAARDREVAVVRGVPGTFTRSGVSAIRRAFPNDTPPRIMWCA